MPNVSRHVVQYAQRLARDVQARALVVFADAIGPDDELRRILADVDFPAVLVSRSKAARVPPASGDQTWVAVPEAPQGRAAQFKSALLSCLARGVLHRGDRVVFLGGAEGSGAIDTAFVFDVGSVPELLSLDDAASLAGGVAPVVFERTLALATQLAAEGREGRPVGTLFVVGDSERVLAQSRSLVLNPFQGHPESVRNILDPAVEETLKEFAGLDGAFVVRDDGVVLSAGTQLVPPGPLPLLPGGLGTRHAAAAGITASTEAVAVCVSQSTGAVSVFRWGRLVTSLQRPGGGPGLLGRVPEPAKGPPRHAGRRTGRTSAEARLSSGRHGGRAV
jgi:DNA integrity scanning protein DisA with diadenylate cyclase activity